MKIGLISDTHGRINPEVFRVFEGVDLILHAGDIGTESVIIELRALAPVQAVTGNVDSFPLVHHWPVLWHDTLQGFELVMIHILPGLTPDAMTELGQRVGLVRPPDIVIYGHSHIARIEQVADTLTINPGSAGPARFRSKPSVALLHLDEGEQPKVEPFNLTSPS